MLVVADQKWSQTYHICSFINLPLFPVEERKSHSWAERLTLNYFFTTSNFFFFFQGALYTDQMKTFLLYSQWKSKTSDLLLEFPLKLLCPLAVAKRAQVAAVGTWGHSVWSFTLATHLPYRAGTIQEAMIFFSTWKSLSDGDFHNSASINTEMNPHVIKSFLQLSDI